MPILPEELGELRRNDPRDEIRGAARSEGNDHPDRPIRVAGLPECKRGTQREHQRQQSGLRQLAHDSSVWPWMKHIPALVVVAPAEAGAQAVNARNAVSNLDPGLRRDDGFVRLLRGPQSTPRPFVARAERKRERAL